MDWFRGWDRRVSVRREAGATRCRTRSRCHRIRRVSDGARRGTLLEADVAASVTGVAGPEPLDGVEPGVVIVGVAIDGAATASTHRFTGDPAAICSRGVEAALDALAHVLGAT